MKLIELALGGKGKLAFDTILKNKENHVRYIEILQEERLAQLADKSPLPGAKIFVSCIGREQAEVEVGVCIRLAPGIGAAEKCGDHAFIGLAGEDKALEDGPVTGR